jgi:peptidoglycan/LPS O-acetylase OafA/YrhL
VVVFFVLSGLVIAVSVQHRRTSFADFMIARAARILPVSIAALAFGTAAFVLVTASGGSAQHVDSYGELTLKGTLLPLVFLSESAWGAGPVWNPPYWSLCYEVWYYALFGAGVLLRGPARIATLCLLALLAGPLVLLMMPVWLVGVTLATSTLARRIGPRTGAALVVGGLIAAWYHTTALTPGLRLMKTLAGPFRDELSYSRFALSDFLLALAVAAILAGLRPLASARPAPWAAIAPAMRRLAGFSFTLYLFHWPILLLAKSAGIAAGHSMTLFALGIGAILALCYVISLGTEAQRDAAKAGLQLLYARMKTRPAVPA